MKVFIVKVDDSDDGIDIYMEDGGYAIIHHTGNYYTTDYCQTRFDPVYIVKDKDIWDKGYNLVNEGKMYYNDWNPEIKDINQEMILDAAQWLCSNLRNDIEYEFIETDSFDEIRQAVEEYNMKLVHIAAK